MSDENIKKGYNFADIIGDSSIMLELKSYALKVASTSSPVLIYGETGTGKELFVQAMHNASPRRNGPFVAQNCAAFPSALLEGILFGTAKGSFTGAEDRAGLFEIANGGTLYLDEINSMPLELQPKLLRVLQDGIIRRIGDMEERKIDVRIIASTNIDPKYCADKGIIRKDLYYRINVVNFRIPELKERKSDIPSLVNHFISKYNKKLNADVKGITYDALEKFIIYQWPGNVRELQNAIEEIMNTKKYGYIEISDLPENIKSAKKVSLNSAIDNFEKNLIKEALSLYKNNISKAAEYLEIPRQTLQYKIKRYGIDI